MREILQEDHLMHHVLDGVVVGDDEHGGAVLGVHPLQQGENLPRGLAVQRAGRLVAQQQARIFDEGPGDGAALLLAARKLGRELVLVLGQAQHLQKLAEVQRAASEVLAHLNVLLHGQVRHEIVELEDEAQLLPAVIRELLCVQAHDLLAVHHDGAAVHRVQPADAVEQGGFA